MTEAAAAEPASRAGGARRALLPLTVLLVVTALLRLWFLPDAARLEGESWAMENVRASFAGEQTRDARVAPLAWYPQRLLLGASQRVYEATGAETLHAFTSKGRVTRAGLRLARLPSVLYGVAGALFLFLVARRLHSVEVGLLAVLILAFSPWHIHASAASTPDVLVLCLSMLALWLAMRALDGPSPARFALVGLALGAAAAAKLTGALVAPPVLAALVFGGRRAPRRLLLALALALPVAALTWWLLTPPLGEYAAALELQGAAQARRAAKEVSSRFTVAVFALLHPLRESVHGRLLGTLAVLGLAGQAFRCLFLVDPGPARAHRLMVAAATPVFALGYAWATPLYKAASFVPLLAYSSLYAAVMLGLLWAAAAELVPRLRSHWTVAAATALVLALTVPAGWGYVHASAVRSTVDKALEWLRNELGQGAPRFVLVEREALAGGAAGPMQLAGGVGLGLVPRLAELDGERLERADGEIFLARELEGADGEFYRGRRRATERRRRFASSLLRLRGPDLVALAHPYGAGPPEEVELEIQFNDTRRLAVVPASPRDSSAVSLVLRLPPTRETEPAPPMVWFGGARIALAPGGFFPRNTFFVSERLPAAARVRPLQIHPPDWMAARRGEIAVASYHWR